MNINGKPYIPESCPALEFDGLDPVGPGLSLYPVTEGQLQADTAAFDPDEEGKPTVLLGARLHFDIGSDSAAIRDVEPFAYVHLEAHPAEAEPKSILSYAQTVPDFEERLGRAYCERIKNCAGVLIRDDKPVCSALDREVFPKVVAETFSDSNEVTE